MRFLKNKIALSAQSKALQTAAPVKIEVDSKPKPRRAAQKQIFSEDIAKRKKNMDLSKEYTKSTKTVVKNYGKAIASFAISQVAVPYLTPFLMREKIKASDFVEYVTKAKETIEGIDTFRALLLIKENDNDQVAAYKRVFQEIADVFINYFSVNWIYSGRMTNKKIHLKLRFKMLRRIRNPELFTYLK